jgi:hypothetical protein
MARKFIRIGTRIINPEMIVSAAWDDESSEPLSVFLVNTNVPVKFEGEQAKRLWAKLEGNSDDITEEPSLDWMKNA